MRRIVLVLSIIVLSVVGCSKKSNDVPPATGELFVTESLNDDVGTDTSDNSSGAQNDLVGQHDGDIEDDETHKPENWESDWNDVTCKWDEEYGGFLTIQECVFPNANLQQVYNIVKRADENLIAELSLKDQKYPSAIDESITVHLEYKSERHLFIRIRYEGGDTYIEIIENDSSTTSKITYDRG